MTVRYAYKDRDEGYIVSIETLPCSEVYLIDGPMDPVGTIARVTRGYSGIYNINEIPPEEVTKALEDIRKTKLQTPLEFGTVVFLVKGVPRSFTHQAVRTRIGASFVQESMRFLGHQDSYRILVDNDIYQDQLVFQSFVKSFLSDIASYELALKRGHSSEKARAVLPTDILTSIYVGYQISTFVRVYEERMCCQAQPGIWQLVIKSMKEQLVNAYGEGFGKLISAPFERGEPCGYRASFDRPCIWQKEKDGSSE